MIIIIMQCWHMNVHIGGVHNDQNSCWYDNYNTSYTEMYVNDLIDGLSRNCVFTNGA